MLPHRLRRMLSHDAEFAFQAGQRVGTGAGAGSSVLVISSFFRYDVSQNLFFEPLRAIAQ